ncbi:MAG: hypothetical protein KF889_10835 [Alphaproteobacteria bacterium]|nr:hypothetical protein [Alphaproteobacteria bacterium]MCW5741320.1 hypothetical protein [Alphaproteobacteria bacterium]
MQGYGDGRSTDGRVISPASRYSHPGAVIDDPALSLQQKRSILAHWASDACAVESDPTLRLAPGSLRPVKVGDIFAALAALDAPTPPRRGGAAQRPPMRDVPFMPAPSLAMAGAA